MKLEEWMLQNRVSDAEVAERLDIKVDRSTISRVRRGKQFPSVALIESIARLTDGQVPPNSFFKLNVDAAAN
jgi:transcriptional regulator with XRE-family HTH domain